MSADLSLIGGSMDPSAQSGMSDGVRQKQQVDALQKRLNSGKDEEKSLREACQGFEAVFINKLLKQMRDTVQKSDFLHSPYEDSYLSMFDQQMAEKFSKDGGIGIGDMLYQQLKGRVLAGKDGKIIKAGDTTTPREGATLPPNRPVTGKGLAMDRMPLPKVDPYKAPERIVFEPLRGPAAVAAAYADPAGQSGRENDGQATDAASQPIQAPAIGTITSEYGWRNDPFTGSKAWHAGLDIAAAAGSQISACWDGKVVFSGEKGGYGKTIILEHEGGWRSVYGHAERITAAVGDEVRAGRKIAEVGSTGRSTGPHVHFELRKGGESVDPELAARSLLAGDPGGQGA